MKRILLILIAALLSGDAPAQSPTRHQLFTQLLADYVHDGVVNYRDLRTDRRLGEYLGQLARTNPDALPGREEQLAFWINAYNAQTLNVICENYPVESINDLHRGGLILGSVLKTTIWDTAPMMINGEEVTLNMIEHEIIRPVFNDPRAHFALVCASKSCPPLRSEAYEGATLGSQLDDQGRRFLAGWCTFDPANRRAELSKIFSWYSGDFGSSDEEVLRFCARFLPDSLAQAILSDPGGWSIDYNPYDWSLNGF